jgi:hypothetical protein
MANVTDTQKFRGFRGHYVIAAAWATRSTQIGTELEREGCLALKAHGDAPGFLWGTLEGQYGRQATSR